MCVDDATYTGEICDLDTQYWDWEHGECYEDAYSCLPSEIKDTTGHCVDNPDFSGDVCLDYQYYDWATLTCITIPECNPWEILDDGVCNPDASYTGEVCNDAQYWDWTYQICEWISICEYYQIELSTGECIDDPSYTGEICDDHYSYYDWSTATCVDYPPCYPW